MNEKIAVIGLGYVGLPVALAFANCFPGTVGFDVNTKKVAELKRHSDRTGEVSSETLAASPITFSSDPADLSDITFFVVAVPTPVDGNRRPDLRFMRSASETVGKVLQPGAVVVYESTVYPGVTEEVCGPVLEQVSGLKQGVDFKLGYSPERINPGDKVHTLESIVKIVSGEDEETLERVAKTYGRIIEAGVHKASSIKVAEAAKVIENVQRDLNISLMNELALIFDKLDIPTLDVLEAAGTKWNFLPFRPGLVGGHCIGIDPYYLTTRAEEVGYHPQVILSGRRINEGMGAFIAQKLIKLLIDTDVPVKGAKVGVLGLTFKEDVADVRNSRVPDIIHELRQFGIEPLLHDPLADTEEAEHEYGLQLNDWSELKDLDGIIVAVAHKEYPQRILEDLSTLLKPGGVIVDVKSTLRDKDLPDSVTCWGL